MGEHGSPRIDTSEHVWFANDQLAVRFIEEIDFDYAALDAFVYQRLPDGSATLDGYPIVWTDSSVAERGQLSLDSTRREHVCSRRDSRFERVKRSDRVEW